MKKQEIFKSWKKHILKDYLSIYLEWIIGRYSSIFIWHIRKIIIIKMWWPSQDALIIFIFYLWGYEKLFSFALTTIIISLSFINSAFANENKQEFIRVTPSLSFTNWFRNVTTSYDISYLFRFGLQSDRSYYIEWPSVCFDTDPIMDGNPSTGSAFLVTLIKTSWFGWSQWERTLYGNGWFQTVKWDNVGSWNYKIRLERGKWRYYDYTYFSDDSARLYNYN